jgi:hypothetical protein
MKTKVIKPGKKFTLIAAATIPEIERMTGLIRQNSPIPTLASNSKVLMDKALPSRKHANVSKNVSRPDRDANVRPLCATYAFTLH